MKRKYLVVAKNTDGRPCCWAQGPTLERVKLVVDRMWPRHGGSGEGCYDGEQRGETEIHIIDENGAVITDVSE